MVMRSKKKLIEQLSTTHEIILRVYVVT